MKSVILKSLETNSTTILPEFGSLMKMGKTIMFNEFLKFDDGKLTKLYASEKSVSESDAKLKIQEFIALIKSSLESNSPFSIENMGTFVKEDGKIKFKISNTSSTTPTIPTSKTSAPTKEKSESVAKEITKAEPKITTSNVTKAEKTIQNETTKVETFIKKEIAPSLKTEDIKKEEILKKVEESSDLKILNKATKQDTNQKENPTKQDTSLTSSTPPNPSINISSEKTSPIEDPKDLKEIVPKEEIKKTATIPAPTTKPTLENKKEEKDTLKRKVQPITSTTTTETKERTKTDDLAAIAAISEGLETDKKKQKKGGFLLWAALLCILIAGGIFGYLKQDLIKGWFESSEIANHTEDKKHSETSEDANDTEKQHSENEETANSSEEMNETTEERTIDEAEHTKTNEEQTATNTINEDSEEEVIDNIKEEPVQKETSAHTTTSSTGSFHIVAGSYSTEENAQKKAEKLKKKGYPDATVLGKFGKLYKVKVSSHTSNEEAKAALKEFKSNGYSGMIKEY